MMIDKNISTKAGLSYSGMITTYIKTKNGKTKKISCVKNMGGEKLFEFLSLCLAGKYTEAEKYRPKYLRLYNNKSTEVPSVIEIPSDAPLCVEYFNNVNTEKHGDSSAIAAILHFTIPIADISNETEYNQVVLFSTGSSVDYPLANHYYVDDDGNWAQQSLANLQPNTTILIDWAMWVEN